MPSRRRSSVTHKIEFKAISDDQRIPEVQSGGVDIVAHTMTILCKRLRYVDFSSVDSDACAYKSWS